MSSLRSPRGGTAIEKTFVRQSKSLRNVPAATAAFKSRFVAAMIRTSTVMDCVPPMRSNSSNC